MKLLRLLSAFLLLVFLLPACAAAQPAIFTPADGQTLPVVQGMITFFWDPGTAPSQAHILTPSGSELLGVSIPPDMTQASLKVEGLLREGTCYTLVLESAAGVSQARFYISISHGSSVGSSSSASSGIGLPHMSPNNLDAPSSMLVDAYNRLLNELANGKGAGFGHSDRQYVYSTDDHEGALAPGIFIYPDTISGNLGDPDSMHSDLLHLLDLIRGNLPDLMHSGISAPPAPPVSPDHSNRFASSGGVQIKPIYFNQNNRTDAMLCMLLDDNGQPIDNKLYLAFRCFIDRQGYLCIFDDPMTVKQYIAILAGKDGVLPDGLDLSALLTIPDDAALEPLLVPGFDSVGHPLIDARNDLVQHFTTNGIYDYSSYVIDYGACNAALSPMILTLTDVYCAGKGGYEQLEADAVNAMLAGIKESLDTGHAGPFEPSVAQALLDGKIAFQPMAYALGDMEYLVFVLNRDGQMIDDSFYLISRMLSEGNTAHLALFTDQDLIRSFVVAQTYTPQRPVSFIPTYTPPDDTPLGYVYKASGSANIRQSSSAESPRVGSLKSGENAQCIGIAENGWYHVLLENGVTGYVSNNIVELRSFEGDHHDYRTTAGHALEQRVNNELASLLYDPSKTSYAAAALRVATQADASALNVAAKGIYDTLTGPIDTVFAFFQETLGGKLDAQYEALVDHVLRTVILQAAENPQPDSFSSYDDIRDASNLLYSGVGVVGDALDLPIDVFTNIADHPMDYLNALYVLARNNAAHDQRCEELAKLAAGCAQSYRILGDIRSTYAHDPAFMRVCDRIEDSLNGYLEDAFGRSGLQAIGDDATEFGVEAVEKSLEFILKKVGGKAVSGAFSAFLFAGDAGKLLTNQSAVLSEHLDTLLCVQRLRKTVDAYAPDALYTDAAYAIYELKAQTDLHALEESRKYFDAYSHTITGAFNTMLGRYDNEKTLSYIDSQIQSITQTRDHLRQDAGFSGIPDGAR